MKVRKLVVLIFALALTAFGYSTAYACSCAEIPALDELIERSKTIMVVRVLNVRNAAPVDIDGGIADIDNGSATAVIERSYKGIKKVGDEVRLANGSGADCGAILREGDVGRRYLILTGSESNSRFAEMTEDKGPYFSVSFCGEILDFDEAVHDLEYLDNQKKNKGRSRLYGFVKTKLAETFGGTRVKVVSGKRVVATTVTKDDGFYEFFDLPPGEFSITIAPKSGPAVVTAAAGPMLSGGLTFDRQVVANIRKGFHSRIDIDFMPDNGVSGRLLGPNNQAVADTTVELKSLDRGTYAYFRSTTNERGEFKFRGVTPDRYLLVVNDGSYVSSYRPYVAHYYPGVTDRAKATEISIATDTKLRQFNIRIGEFIDFTKIKGIVRYSDGSPVDSASLNAKLKFNEKMLEFSDYTSKDGRFSIELPANIPFELSGYKYFRSPETCPGEPFLSLFDERRFEIRPIVSSALDDVSNIVIELPFPACDEKR